MRKGNPPLVRLTEFILNGLIKDHSFKYTVIEDLNYRYNQHKENNLILIALIRYLSEFLLIVASYYIESILWGRIMFRNYFKTLYRNISRQKIYTFLNVFGLAFGLACFILIFKYIQFELSYETNHENADRIYKVVTQTSESKRIAVTSAPLAPAMMEELPEVEYAIRLESPWSTFVRHQDKVFYEKN